MRMAALLSGQLRQWELAVDNQKWFWESAEQNGVTEIDYFIHTWSYSADRAGVSHEYEWKDIDKEEFQKICDAYEVKDSMYDTKPQSWFYDYDHWSALFYSFSQSVMMKRKYELKHNFEYDIVIKSRPDVVFNPKRTAWLETPLWDNHLYSTHGGEMGHEFGMFNIDDCVFYSNSYTMDIMSNMYQYRQKNLDCRYNKEGLPDKETLCTQQLGPGVLMHEYCRDYGITPIITSSHRSHFQPTLLKLGCPTDLDLFKVRQFNKMEKYFREFYTK